MANIDIKCPIAGCDFSTGLLPEAVAVVLLSTHAISHKQSNTANVPMGPKLDRPRVELGISMEKWNLFERKWNVFKSGSGIPDNLAAAQLFQCADEALGDSLLKIDPNIVDTTVDTVLGKMKSLAVIPVAISVLRAELLEMKQKRDEPFRTFASRVRGKAETCEFFARMNCVCGQLNRLDYTDHMMRDVLVAGIYDAEIRREILGVEGIIDRPINDVVSLLEKKEMARDANIVRSSTFAISSRQESYRTPKVSGPPPGFKEPSSAQKAKRASCPQCREQFSPFVEGPRGWNLKPHEMCRNCFRFRRPQYKAHSSSNPPSLSSICSEDAEALQVISQISVISTDTESSQVPHFKSSIFHMLVNQVMLS